MWPDELSADLRAGLDEIRKRSAAAVDPPILPHFTDHTVTHFDRVATNFLRLIEHAQTTAKQLSKEEMFVGLAACYLHDVALQSTAGVSSGKVGSLSAAEILEIRDRHADIAAAWIQATLKGERKKYNDLDIPELGVESSDEIRELAPFIATLCKLHSGNPEKCKSLKDTPFRDGTLRLRLLVHLLRLADALDLDARRVNMKNLDRWRLAPDSLLHWWRHHYVQSVSIDSTGGIQVVMVFPSELTSIEIETFRTMTEREIVREISPAQVIFRQNELFPQLLGVTVSTEFNDAKRPLPPELKEYIGSKADSRIAVQITPVPEAGEDRIKKPKSWITFWNFKGNPWNDLPVSYADLEFVETFDVKEKMDELDGLLSGSKGEIRLVFGKRGAGKTTFLENLREKYKDRAIISSHDLSRIGAPVATAQQLYAWIFPRILTDLTQKVVDHDKLGPEHFRKAMDEFHIKKPIVLVDNLDRYAEKADLNMIRQFFQLAQGNLQAMKRKSIIVISATDEWKPELERADLSYIGKSSLWDVKPFKPTEVRELIDKRLRIAGSAYERVFDPDVYKLLHKIAAGNPRRVLDACATLCRNAADEGILRISTEMVEENFANEIKNKVTGLIVQASRESQESRAGFESFYAFYLGAERTGPLADEGWRLLQQLVEKGGIPQDIVPEKLAIVFAKVAALKSRVGKEGGERRYWQASQASKVFLRALKDKGLPAADFLSYYKNKPVVPSGVDHDAILKALATAKLQGDAAKAMERASQAFADLQRASATPVKVMLKARWCLEYLVVAFLIAKGVSLPPRYILDHDEGRFLNANGQPRQKFNWVCIQEMQDLMSLFDQHKSQFIESYREMRLLQKRSEDYFRDYSFGAKLDSNDVKIISAGIAKVFNDLAPIVVQTGEKALKK